MPLNRTHDGPLVAAGAVLGVGLGGFVDGILLHQLLQWHNMLSARIPPVDLEGIIDHQLLGIHHVHPGAHQLVWDLGFLGSGLALALVGVLLIAAGRRAVIA